MGWEDRSDDERHEAYLEEQAKRFWWRDAKFTIGALAVMWVFLFFWWVITSSL